MPSAIICSVGLMVSMPDVSPSSGDLNFHSILYRACSGGSSVDQVNTTWSPCSARVMAVGNGDDSAVIDVVIPHTTGSSLAGNIRVMLSRPVGSRIARCHHGPHLWPSTVYT